MNVNPYYITSLTFEDTNLKRTHSIGFGDHNPYYRWQSTAILDAKKYLLLYDFHTDQFECIQSTNGYGAFMCVYQSL